MKRRSAPPSRLALHPTFTNPECTHARRQAVLWLTRLLECRVPMDRHFFECLGWAMGGVQSLYDDFASALKQLGTPSANKALAYVQHRMDGDDGDKCFALEKALLVHPVARRPMGEVVAAACKFPKAKAGYAPFVAAQKNLRRYFGLNEHAARFCEYVFLQEEYVYLNNYFEGTLELHRPGNHAVLAKMLGMPLESLRQAIKDSVAMRILDAGAARGECMTLVSKVKSLWSDINPDQVQKLFYEPVAGSTLPLDDFEISDDDIATVRSLLASTNDMPVHIMLYGVPGTGKTTFARSLAEDLGMEAYAVSNGEGENGGDRRACLVAAANMVVRQDKAFLIADEAEHLLTTGGHFSDNPYDKAWLNAFLEKPGQRIVWIVNDIEAMHKAVLRRFTFSIPFEQLTHEQRLRSFEQILAKQRVTKLLKDDQVDVLVRTYSDAPIATFDMAVRQARALTRGAKKFYGMVDQLLDASVTLTNGGVRPERIHAAPDYNIEGACLKGSAKDLLTACRRADAAMRNGEELRPCSATMLFYGPPGTGKTALARYIADSIGRECVVKQASDLLGPHVGETEGYIAEAFATAENKGQVLVIDEADSFLFSRESAHHSWERTAVNEFLTQLENCRGFCICTTNSRTTLDAASMRRFAHKEEFTYATPKQVQALYTTLLAPLCKATLSDAQKARLAAMKNLAPGDFHAVQGQYGSFFVDRSKVTHDVLLDALEKETKLKLEHTAKPLGFRA